MQLEGHSSMTAGHRPSLFRKYFAGTFIVVLCLATPIAIGILMLLRVRLNPAFLVLAALCAALGIALALGNPDDEAPPQAGAPEDDE